MPIFEYKCKDCDSVEEFLETASSKKHLCNKCGAEMKKIFSSFSPRMAAQKNTCAKNPSCPMSGNCPNSK